MADPVRPTTSTLIHLGLHDLDKARVRLDRLARLVDDQTLAQTLVQALGQACDPDEALAGLTRILEQYPQGVRPDFLYGSPRENQEAAQSLIRVLGASEAMGRLMRSRPELVEAAALDPDHLADCPAEIRQERILDALARVETNSESLPSLAAYADALRSEYRLQLAAVMARDLAAEDPLELEPAISRALSDMADAALQGALSIARRQVPDVDSCRLAVIGMGKLGAQELNYVSDVDLMYLVEPASGTDTSESDPIAVGTAMAVLLQRVCQSVIPGSTEPPLWKVDTALRPEGRDGPLVRRLASYADYYAQWAENWEFQALLKARPVAGDKALGQDYSAMIEPLVWGACQRPNFVYDCQRMRQRVERLIPENRKEREIKLGQGGLRDVEFTVQMLQLVHGSSDEDLRCPATLDALQALSRGGYISRKHGDQLDRDYRFERVMEHRLQMWQLRRTHLFPKINRSGTPGKRPPSLEELEGNRDLRRLARAFGLHADQMLARYQATRIEVRNLHQAIYFRPMLPINAQVDEDEVSLRPQAARARFASIGFADPDAAIRHVTALTTGVTRSARINRILMPAVLQWLGEGQDPDMGLLGWRTLEEHFGGKSTYLGFLRDSTSAARRLCHVLSNSRYLSGALARSVQSVTWLGHDQDMIPRDRATLDKRAAAYRTRHADSLEEFATAVRAMRRQEIERIGLGWMSGVDDQQACLAGMSDVYDAAIDAALDWAVDHRLGQTGSRDEEPHQAPAEMALIAMGRYGGREVNFNSDADIMLVYRPASGAGQDQAAEFARGVTADLRAVLTGRASLEPGIDLDFDLRPEGRQGPLVRSLDSYQRYYRDWSDTWEHQALIRARFAAGNAGLAKDFLEGIANPLRYPQQPPNEEELGQIRRLKARMEAERLPRGVRRDRHLKLGRGGLSDVEWTVQLLQLRHAHDLPELQVTGTLTALDALEASGLIEAKDAKALRRSWVLCTAARNANFLWSGRVLQADILPDDGQVLGGIAVCLGYPAHRGQHFVNELLAAMRRCRQVMERLFYGG
ncbi:bifunctional [glutamine synthetase] adenylyltransferase/[glutamine synthetase]-adenylyl-L-tyrosine phosphorylase [Bifidobacterium sp. W8113]|uniref:bifunctional [glutamine synthetase] adenylyltransferase/[glutamine synthetase]-adenylyl-L-tyrosine phosphorylase n=1 Tax=Bifidobacterium choladohabitans TaxID=2750947 RepID=UPI0018DCE662|nr:bifunctional [glutamine synthetase] adenylyltransferase/[glutamine synthetase]-adenylyl-L-tyrosine phosphorylase [Bifidobacterium choladohabitans]MBI0090407.1 bifunctional [glutamine synthetase] adenylyltransferase/[glutamine synthetase]-adenylyl-L-tyrosine phosphorylase [Bifidobacterium choladohabitans]